MQAIRIIEISDCKMVSSGVGMFGEENFTAFNAWFSALPRINDARDFVVEAAGGMEGLFIYEDGIRFRNDSELLISKVASTL